MGENLQGGSNSDPKNALKIQGLPYQTTDQQICDFFGGYGVLTESVHIGKYPDGKATGQAVALFNDENTAASARNDLNRKYIGKRYVELIQIS